MSVLHWLKELDGERANIWKYGMRWAVEARRKERSAEQEQRRQDEQGQNGGQEQSKQDKRVRFGEEEQFASGKHRRARGNG